ncbi:TonB-dependent receptor [Sphingomonas sp.]|jgi:TonB-dependent receptor|uniref:TonB-dependent receptor n=1 Tax=Sphingomonas sp. TaxID=28214 RepID=UPI002D7FEE08|nr:TonB-dependent receptor [Sphingomonas sp.]HEU0045297.1 TonB-dependent receptor [Sphingomonas sp.]
MIVTVARRRLALRFASFATVSLSALLAAEANARQAATPATAESVAEAQTGDAQVQDVVVRASRPIAESEAAALRIQRNSDSLVTVAAADAVGRLPDQNIAQATGRLPGVSVERDQGQARYVNLRGAPKTWTTLSFDGINVVSPEGRDSRFDSIPSAIASQIIVSKAVTPDMPGETISGNVNVVTRSAFDYRGFHLGAKVGGGLVDLGNREEFEGALVVSNNYDTGVGRIGWVVSGSYYQRNMITDNFENDWEQVAQDRRPGFEDRYWVRETENKLYRLTRKNWSLSGRLDWQPSADTDLSLRSIYTIFTDDEARDNYILDLDDRQGDLVASTAPCPAAPTPPTTSAYADVCTGNSPVLGTVYGVDINQRSTLRAFRQSIFTNTASLDQRFGDGWGLKLTGNYTRSIDDRSVTGENRFDSPSTRTARPTVAYDFRDSQLARVRLFTSLQSGGVFSAATPVTDIDSFTKPLTSFRTLDAVDTTEAYTGRAELRREIGLFGGEATLRAGFQFDQRTKTADESEILLSTAAQFAAAGFPATTYRPLSIDGPFKGEIPLGYTFRYFSVDAMRDLQERAEKAFPYTPVTGNNYAVRERIYAGYLMGTVRYNWGSVVGGARVEKVENRGRAVGTVAGVVVPVEAEASSTLVFPSLHVNANVGANAKLRVGFTSGAARADYDQLRPNVVVNDSNLSINGGNPGVKPERAYGVDAYLEYYAQPQGFFMIGAYYKRVEDVLFNSSRTFGSDALNSGGVDRSGYTFSGIVNGGSGYLLGAEAAAQQQLEPYAAKLGLPAWAGGFGISANVTLNKSEVTKPAIPGTIGERKLRLPGTSDVVVNAGGYYEKYGLSLRLQYQMRTDWLDTVADTLVDAGDTYWALDTELDFSARYELRRGVEIYFDAANLLNQPGRRYSDIFRRDRSRTIEWERFGRRYTGGVRVTL